MKMFGFKTAGLIIVASLAGTAYAADAGDAKLAVDKNAPSYVRCIRVAETGSLVKKTKICRTNAEWNNVSDHQRRDADDFITRSRSGMNPSG